MPQPPKPFFATPALVVEETGAYVREQQAHLYLARAAEVAGAGLAAALAPHGLTGKLYNVLRAVRRAGAKGLTAAEIGAQMTDPRADVTRLVDRLVREGFVARAGDARDRRIVRTILTPAGAKTLAALDPIVIATHRRQFAHMRAEDVERLIELLQALLDA
jgi:DNA-binding MarR family transcriptional regulator